MLDHKVINSTFNFLRNRQIVLPQGLPHFTFSGSLTSSINTFSPTLYEICSAFNCSFDEFVGEKVVSPSYSSAILAPPHPPLFKLDSLVDMKWLSHCDSDLHFFND